MMRVYLYVLLALIMPFCLHAQNVVHWKYSAKKIANKIYEVRITANVQGPWHIYSQTTPDGGPLPTKISFNKNPLVTLTGKPKEVGKLLKKHEEVFGVDVKYFNGNVDFVQVVKLKNHVKTNIAGTIEFMACNDEQCMPPKTEKFSIQLE